MKHLIYIIYFILAFSSHIYAQKNNYVFENLGIANGLSQSTVNAILQDKKGFMWFATQDGLNRYDGYNFKIYRPDFENPENTLTSGFVDILKEDNYGNLVIRARGNSGITFFRPDLQKFYQFAHNPNNPNSIPNNNIFFIHIDNNNDVWMAHEKGFTQMHFPKPGEFDSVVIVNSQKFLGKTLQELMKLPYLINTDKDNHLYVMYKDTLYYFNDKTDIFSISLDNIPANASRIPLKIDNIYRVGRDSEYNFWILFEDRVEKIVDVKTNKKVVYKIKHGFIKNYNNDFYIARDSCLYSVIMDRGLVSIDLRTGNTTYIQHDPRNAKSLISNNSTGIQSFYEDKNGNIWIGTSNGISKYSRNKNKFTHFAPDPGNPDGLQDAWPFAFAEDKNGLIWIGTYLGSGLHMFDKKLNKFSHIPLVNENNKPLRSDIYAIHRDKDNVMWISNGQYGIYSYNEKTKKFRLYDNRKLTKDLEVEFNVVNAIREDSKGNFWLATTFGVQRFNKTTSEFKTFLLKKDFIKGAPAHENFVQTILIENDSTIWVGGGTGLFRMKIDANDNAHLTAFPANVKDSTSLSYNQIFSLYLDNKGNLWVGTIGGGLNKMDLKTQKFKRYTQHNGLSNNVVYGILEDDNGRLWMSTNAGISVLNPENETFTVYTVNHGLQSNEFNQGAFFKDSEKMFYFGGVNGFNMFYPNQIQADTTMGEVVFTDFKLFNKSVLPGNNSPLTVDISFATEIELNYWQRDFTFEFASNNLTSPGENTYAYQIENYHDEWVHLGKNHVISFTGFPYGEYVLKIKTANADGVWSNKITSIKLIIRPPFWKTIWFQILVVLALIGLVVLYFQWKARALKRDKQILEMKVRERTAEIEKQKDEILEKNEELNLLNEEISAQRDSLKELNEELLTKNEEIKAQNEEIEEKNANITASILYAKRIQKAVMPSAKILEAHFEEHFVYFKPRDIVSGDFYYVRQVQEWVLVAAADCTGHGVPGAFMSMLGLALLNEIARNPKITKSSEVLNELREQIKLALQQTGARGEQQDGMDISFCAINTKTLEMSFAGAHNSCIIFTSGNHENLSEELDENTSKPKEREIVLPDSNSKLIVLEADHMPVGIYAKEYPFTEHTFQLKKDDVIYLYTDGYYSQFGGEKNEKFKTKRFQDTLISMHKQTMPQQKVTLDTTMHNWQGNYEQVDDILVIGIKI